MNRRVAILGGLSAIVALDASPDRVVVRSPRAQNAPLPADLVRDFVRHAHADLPAVREALERQPRLANACWDWGDGDFESAIGAATHMGRRDIVDLLLAAGARPDIFTFVVLHDLDGLEAQLKRHPGLVRCRGPHGLSFEAHAEATGSSAVVARVQALVADARAARR